MLHNNINLHFSLFRYTDLYFNTILCYTFLLLCSCKQLGATLASKATLLWRNIEACQIPVLLWGNIGSRGSVLMPLVATSANLAAISKDKMFTKRQFPIVHKTHSVKSIKEKIGFATRAYYSCRCIISHIALHLLCIFHLKTFLANLNLNFTASSLKLGINFIF